MSGLRWGSDAPKKAEVQAAAKRHGMCYMRYQVEIVTPGGYMVAQYATKPISAKEFIEEVSDSDGRWSGFRNEGQKSEGGAS